MEWQPIETAPKNKPVLGYRAGDMATVKWRATWKEWALVVPGTYAEDDDWEPTHWMPLPDPRDPARASVNTVQGVAFSSVMVGTGQVLGFDLATSGSQRWSQCQATFGPRT
jgi:hypothetical protein